MKKPIRILIEEVPKAARKVKDKGVVSIAES